MILCIAVNLVKFCVSEVGEFWWRFFYFAWRKRGGGERGVVDGTNKQKKRFPIQNAFFQPHKKNLTKLAKINLISVFRLEFNIF
jgi:N-glycosylase/DNA lyase